MPRFDERFRYAYDKRTHSIQMQYLGFDFIVLPRVFYSHLYHEAPPSLIRLKKDKIISGTAGRTFKSFKLEMAQNVQKEKESREMEERCEKGYFHSCGCESSNQCNITSA